MCAVAKGGTPAIVMLQTAGVAFEVHEFHHEPGEKNYGQVAAAAIGISLLPIAAIRLVMSLRPRR